MTKKLFATAILLAVALIALIGGITVVPTEAQAASVDVEKISEIQLILTPTERAAGTKMEFFFGETGHIEARFDDGDDSTDEGFYDEVYATYQWFFRAEGGSEWVGKKSRYTTEVGVSLDVSECSDSGDYYLEVIQFKYGGEELDISSSPLRSDIVTVSVLPLPVSVTFATTKPIYNGYHQDIGYTLSRTVEGADPLPYVEYSASPTGAGTYRCILHLRNANYQLVGNTEADFTIKKAELTIRVQDVTALAGYSYTLQIQYEGFCGNDDETCLESVPTVSKEDLNYREAGFYEIYANGPDTDKNYNLTYEPGTVQINTSSLSEDQLSGFSGKVSGSFSADTILSVQSEDAGSVADKLPFYKVASDVYKLSLSGESNLETYNVLMRDVELTNLFLNVCFINDEGETERIEGYKYDKEKKTLSFELSQKSGYIVMYNNWLWVAIPAAVVVILAIALLIFHSKDNNKYRVDRVIVGAARAEADRYRSTIGEYHKEQQSKIDNNRR